MNRDEANPIRALPLPALAEIASQVLGTAATGIANLQVEKIGRSNGEATLGIYRVVGQAQTAGGEQGWSAVAKVLKVPEKFLFDAQAELARELTVYRSGVFAKRCGGIRAARCYGIQQQDDLQLLWLEDLSAAPQAPWRTEYYLETARHLGQFNAHWPAQALPNWEWLSHQSLQQMFAAPFYVETFQHLPAAQNAPLLKQVTQQGMTARLLDLWRNQHLLFEQVEAGAKGICHWDCHPKNLFPMVEPTGQSFTIAIDWAAVGIGCLGIDIGHLLGSPLTWLEISVEQAQDLVEPLLAAYLAGLRAAGWQGAAEQVKLTYLTRLGCEAFRITGLIFAAAHDPQMVARIELLLRLPIAEVAEQWQRILHFLLRHTDAACQLANRP